MKSGENEVFFGIVYNLQFYAGFRYSGNCVEEGMFEKECLKHGYKRMNGRLYSVGDPMVYEKAYEEEKMTFRNTKPSIKDDSGNG